MTTACENNDDTHGSDELALRLASRSSPNPRWTRCNVVPSRVVAEYYVGVMPRKCEVRLVLLGARDIGRGNKPNKPLERAKPKRPLQFHSRESRCMPSRSVGFPRIGPVYYILYSIPAAEYHQLQFTSLVA